jgi:hypothetical protein
MGTWIVLALLTVNSSALPYGTFNHVRSGEQRMRELIEDGYVRSATFRALVDETDALSCVVYIATVTRLSKHLRGALLHDSAGIGEMPLLRVLVKASLPRDTAIATIAHELQHVVEAIGAAAQRQWRACSIVWIWRRIGARTNSRRRQRSMWQRRSATNCADASRVRVR